MSALSELFQFQCQVNLLLAHRTKCDVICLCCPKHVTGCLQVTITPQQSAVTLMRLDKTWKTQPLLFAWHTVNKSQEDASPSSFVIMKSPSDNASRDLNLWIMTLTYCLVQLGRPSPLRTCKSFWLRNAFPVTLPASCANARMKILLQKRHTWTEEQLRQLYRQNSAEMFTEIKRRWLKQLVWKVSLLRDCFYHTSHRFPGSCLVETTSPCHTWQFLRILLVFSLESPLTLLIIFR